jgi:hypothetical protein
MSRTQLPRIYELRDLTADPTSPDAYFQNFDEYVQDSLHVRQIYARWEKDLQGLDHDAWEFLKSEASPYLMHKDRSGRGWQQLFGILNQAHAYNYLKAIGSSNVRFIPRAKQRSMRTPDLEGLLGSGRVLCEVKTINISEKEVHARNDFTVVNITNQLDDGFLQKLRSDITEAKGQMHAYDATDEVRYYVYINLCFDDFLGAYKEEYFRQIDQYLSDCLTPGIDLVFHNDRTPFHNALAMTTATVVNAN